MKFRVLVLLYHPSSHQTSNTRAILLQSNYTLQSDKGIDVQFCRLFFDARSTVHFRFDIDSRVFYMESWENNLIYKKNNYL